MKLAAGALDDEQRAIHLVLTFHLQPVLVLVLVVVGRHQPCEALDTRLSRLHARLNQARLYLASDHGEVALTLLAFSLSVGPTQSHQGIRRRLSIELDVYAAVFA